MTLHLRPIVYVSVLALAGCGPRAVATHTPSPEHVQSPNPASPNQEPPVDSAPAIELEVISGSAEGFPALSADGQQIAFVEVSNTCCSDAFEAVAKVVGLDGASQAEWRLVDTDESGVSRISEGDAEERVLAFNTQMQAQRFYTMRALDPSRSEPGVLVQEDRIGTLGRPETEWMLPVLELSPYCCDGGLGEVSECRVIADIGGIWREGDVLVVATGREVQADGCSVGWTFHVMRL